MFDVGVDLAWGTRSPTGLAVLDAAGHLVDLGTARTDDELSTRLRPWTDACLVGIDAPIVVRNASGSRPCERLVGRHFGRFGASCHSANTANPAFAGGDTRALRLARALDLDVDPASTATRRAVEVYPHPAIVVLFDLPRIVRYKAKPGRDLPSLGSELLRLMGLLEQLEHADPPLVVRASPAWAAARAAVEGAATKAALRRVEDPVDAVVCAYVARLARLRPDRVRVLGTLDEGYVVTPVSPVVAAAIDATTDGRPA